MRTKLTSTKPHTAFDRLLDALARELIDVSDDEILAAAKELGMNPMMKGSAAFLGLRVPPIADLADWAEFFGSEHFRRSIAALSLKNETSCRSVDSEFKVTERKH